MIARLKAFFLENTLFLRFFCAIMALSLFLIVLVSGVVYACVSQTVTEQLASAERHYMQSIDGAITTHLQTAQRTADALAANSNVVKGILQRSSSWVDTLYNCNLAVRQALAANAYLAGVYLVGGDEILLKSERNYQSSAYDDAVVDMVVNRAGESLIPWTMDSGRKTYYYASIVMPIDTLSIPNNVGGVLVTLDMGKVSQQVFDESNGIFYVVNSAGQVLLSSVNGALLQTSKTLPLLTDGLAGAAETQLAGQRYVVTRTDGELGCTLYHFTPHKQFYSSLTNMALVMLGVVLACAALAVLLALSMARRVYRPVKSVFIQLSTTLPQPEDASDKLNELQRASRVITCTYETINAYRQDMDASALRACLVSGRMPKGGAEGLIKYLGGTEPPEYRLIVIAVPEAATSCQMAANIVGSYLSERYQVTTVSTENDTITLALASRRVSTETDIADTLKVALASLRQFIPQPVLLSVSDTAQGPETLHAQYQMSVSRLRVSMLYAASAILHGEPTTQAVPKMDALCEQARAQDHAGYQAALAELCARYIQLPVADALDQLALLGMRVQSLQKQLAGQNDPLSLYSANAKRLDGLHSYTQLAGWFTELYMAYVAQLQDAQDPDGSRQAALALTYIDQHFVQSTLSATQTAEAMGISVSHLSRILKRHTGKTFLDIVAEKRMEKAASLLTGSPSMSIVSLCQACGFSSPSYFTASFKKTYGVTPSAYRGMYVAERLTE